MRKYAKRHCLGFLSQLTNHQPALRAISFLIAEESHTARALFLSRIPQYIILSENYFISTDFPQLWPHMLCVLNS